MRLNALHRTAEFRPRVPAGTPGLPNADLVRIRREVTELQDRVNRLATALGTRRRETGFRADVAGMKPEEAVEHLLSVLDWMTQDAPQAVPAELRLTKTEARCYAALKRRMGGVVTLDTLLSAMYWDKGADYAPLDGARTVIRKLRRKLEPQGLRVVSHSGIGYSMQEEAVPARLPPPELA